MFFFFNASSAIGVMYRASNLFLQQGNLNTIENIAGRKIRATISQSFIQTYYMKAAVTFLNSK
jgi:hypothetical protein